MRVLREIERMDELVADINNAQIAIAFNLCEDCNEYQPGYIDFGIYQTQDGLSYDCRFFPEESCADAIGPLPLVGQTGARGEAFNVNCTSIKEARKLLAESIGFGHF